MENRGREENEYVEYDNDKLTQLELAWDKAFQELLSGQGNSISVTLLISFAMKKLLEERLRGIGEGEELPEGLDRNPILVELSSVIAECVGTNFNVMFDKAAETVHGAKQ